MLYFFKKRLSDEKYSNSWKIVFYSFRYIQSILLLVLFFNGIQNLNNVKNLGYMLFFVVYTAYEEVYRKTCFLLVMFNASFIMGQYMFSFTYPLFIGDQEQMVTRFKWLNLYPSNDATNPFNISPGHLHNMYF